MKSLLFTTAALVGLAVSTAFGQAVVDPELKAAFATGAPVQQVVVSFKGSGAPSLAQVGLLRSLGITKGLTMQALPIAGVLATSAQVTALAGNPEVRSVFVNKRLDYYNYHDTNLTGVKRLRADQTITARNNGTPVSGRGIGVLINDSGVDGTHDDIKFGSHLVQNTLGQTNLNNLNALLPVSYIEGVPNTDTNSGHGTHCAGTVGGNGTKSSGKYEGVAPGASLLGYGSGAALLVLDAIGGFDYALTHQYQYNIRVVSNSFGSSGTFDPEAPINIVTKKVYDRGMVVVFAAGNSGPGADTHNPYAIAPWTISVGAGDRAGQLASFSSRGVKGQGGTFVADGQTWTYKNEPTIVAPGVDVVSTRVLGPVATLGIQEDATSGELAANEIPFYTHMSGTSMATPHTAGICALILEAKPSLTPAQVKALLEKTATNMPGRESWEVGAGYVNAYAAVDQALRNPGFGTSVNVARTFNASVNSVSTSTPFQVSYNPALTAANSFTFQVASGATSLEAKITSTGLLGQTGNATNLILIDPAGTQYRSGTPLAFALYPDRSVAVTSPTAGTWTLKVDGLRGVALPETVSGNLTVQTNTGTTNLNDIAGAPSEAAIKLAISRRLVDGLPTGYKPYENLTRLQLADYLLMGQGIRQYLPTDGTRTFQDVSSPADVLLAEATTAKGAALRDRFQQYKGVMLPTAAGTFSPQASVRRDALAYSLVQSLGFQAQAEARNGQPVTVNVNGQTLPLDDARDIAPGLEGYVSIALELNLINGFYSVAQGPYDLQPVLHVAFQPYRTVSRGEFAVIITRTFAQYDALTQPAAAAARTTSAAPAASLVAASPNATAGSREVAAYPNPCVNATTISYFVAQDGPVSVEVFTPLGRKVRTLVHSAEAAGNHEVSLDASSLAQGTYLYTVKTGDATTTKRLVVQ